MPVPLAIAAPAVTAGLAYLNAKHSVFYDYQLLSSAARATLKVNLRDRKDRMNGFYTLETNAKNKKTANKTFIIYEGRHWTYKESYDTVLKYAAFFKNTLGVKAREIVGLDYMNSEKFIFIWFSLWSLGAWPAFINYNLTGKALAHCLRISTTAKCILDPEVESNVTQDVRQEVPGVEFLTFTPGLEAKAMSIQPYRAPDKDRSEKKRTNMAMLIFTSGTTGLPKAAIMSWAKMTMSASHTSDWGRWKSNDILYTCMPLYHSSASVMGCIATLEAGKTLHVGHKFSTKTFWPDVRSSKATIIQYVGETCRYLLSAPPQYSADGKNLDLENHVRMAFGNGLRPDIWNRFKERFGIETIAEFYAATEGSSGLWNWTRNDFGAGGIGRTGLVANVFLGATTGAIVRINWETEQPYRDPKTGLCERVPIGEPGEQLFGLDAKDIESKFQGYFNNEGANQGKIMRNVFKKGDAWFRTGDVIRESSDGLKYFMDRIGDTFRWKSENVSTNEVSECLGRHPAVDEANVYGVELPHHDGRAGCVSITFSDTNNSITNDLLRDLAAHAKNTLPRFAVPLFLRVRSREDSAAMTTGTNKQQKHVLRTQGVDPGLVGSDEVYWLRPGDGDGGYRRFGVGDWEEIRGQKVRL